MGSHKSDPRVAAPGSTSDDAAARVASSQEPPVAAESAFASGEQGSEEPAQVVDDAERGADQDPDAPGTSEGTQPDLDELMAKAGKADEYLALAQRTQADFENYRKRAMREAAAAQDRGVAKLAKELLPAVDNLDRALEAALAVAGNPANPGNAGNSGNPGEPAQRGASAPENGSNPLISGIKLVHADVIAALARFGIEPFSPVGEPFDPQHHEAIAQQPVEGAQPGTVVEVYQRGYRLGDSVLRPARVVVAG
jgi:molecular chaperone GrpE